MIKGYRGTGSLTLCAAAALTMMMASSGPLRAAETLKLTVISGYPPAISWVKSFMEAFEPAVAADLAKTGHYKIDWNEGVSGTIAKPRGELDAVASGLGEVGLIGTVFTPDKLPLYNFPFVTPFSTKDMRVVANAYVDLEKRFPAFAAGWAKYNQVSLSPSGVVDNYVLFTSKPVKRAADLKGMKIGAAGVNLPWVTAVGAVGVSSTLPDMYTSLGTHLYEGVIMYSDAAGKFKLCQPAPYVLDAGMGATNGYSLTVNQTAWQGLPDEVRTAMSRAAVLWRDRIADIVTQSGQQQLANCKSKYHTQVTVLPAGERKTWAAALPNLAKQWAARVDGQGLPGTEVLGAYMDALRAAKQPIARNWDRE